MSYTNPPQRLKPDSLEPKRPDYRWWFSSNIEDWIKGVKPKSKKNGSKRTTAKV